MKLEQYRLDRLPEIVSQMMKPAEKIDSIRIHQIKWIGGGEPQVPAAIGDGSQKAPINQVMDSIRHGLDSFRRSADLATS